MRGIAIWPMAILIAFTVGQATKADSIYGKCVRKDGSKAGSTVIISTSWNNKKAYPANGRYVLDFGKKLNRSITVYVNGKTFGRVKVSGQTLLDITVP